MKALPFPCIRPVPEHAAEVAALPYDVFDRAEAAAYVAGHPLSFLNIDRPETQFDPEHDMYAPEVYARGAELLRERIEDGTFVEDKNLAYYIYQLAWEAASKPASHAFAPSTITSRAHQTPRAHARRQGARSYRAHRGPRLPNWAHLPHLPRPARAGHDRGRRQNLTPLYDFTDEAGVRQTVWEVARRDAVDALHAMLGQIPCAYIADGHHRAASAVKVAQRMREQAKAEGMYTGKEPFNYFLSVLFPASQLTILPYNRVVADRNGLDTHELLEALIGTGFGIIEATGPVEPSERGVFGMFTDGTWYELHGDMRDAVSAVASLDVSILQDHILAPILGIDDPRTDPRISFVGGIRGTDELEARAGKNGIAFTLCATGIDQLLTIADAGEVMPPKSTWFEPKLRSGLFIHRIAK